MLGVTLLPTFSKLLSFCHFLQKEKGFHYSLCVHALGHPSSLRQSYLYTKDGGVD